MPCLKRIIKKYFGNNQILKNMEQTFEQYVLSWWTEYIENHQDDSKRLMELFIGEEETIEDYLDEGETPCDWLMTKGEEDAEEIYEHFFGYCADRSILADDLPDTETFLTEMFKQAYTEKYDFVDELIEDMAGHAEGYDTPYGFFHDLSYGGCSSGMIGMFVYNSDCKRFYIQHIDDLEAFVEDFEEEIGEPVRNDKHLPHYVFICWFCYEELAYNVARTLYPESF